METKTEKSEWIELQSHRALYDSASEELKRELGLKLEDIDGILCSVSSAEPSILINRCFVTEDSSLKNISVIRAVREFYASSGVGEFFMHVRNCDQQGRENLEKAGMKKSRGWMKFSRDTAPAVARNADLDIREIGSEYANDFARIVVPCFDLTEASIPLIAGIVKHPDYHVYMGFDGDRPAATGIFFYKDNIAYCGYGATHRDFRGRGFQGAILARRINDAIKMGANILYTETGEAVPGDPQHSYTNILRYGFTEYYLRENWVPA